MGDIEVGIVRAVLCMCSVHSVSGKACVFV